MASLAETARYLQGSLLIFRGRPEGLRAFDMSFDGFWQSFSAIVPMAPFLAVMIASERLFVMRDIVFPEDFGTGEFVAMRVVAVLVDWFGFPILLAVLARPFGFEARYVPLVVVLNWSSLAVAIPFALPHLLHATGLIGGDLASFVHIFMLAAAFRLEYLVFRLTLGAAPALAAGFVALDAASSILLDVALSALARAS